MAASCDCCGRRTVAGYSRCSLCRRGRCGDCRGDGDAARYASPREPPGHEAKILAHQARVAAEMAALGVTARYWRRDGPRRPTAPEESAPPAPPPPTHCRECGAPLPAPARKGFPRTVHKRCADRASRRRRRQRKRGEGG